MTTTRNPEPRQPQPAALAHEELELLYRALSVRLARRAAWRYCLSVEDASEVVQDVFLLALVKLSGEGSPRTWLYRTLDNLAANRMRKEIRRRSLLARWEGFESRPVDRISARQGSAWKDTHETE